MRSGGWLEIAVLGSSSWMPYVPQGVKGLDDDDVMMMMMMMMSLRNKCPINGFLSINVDIRDLTSVDKWFGVSFSSGGYEVHTNKI